MVRRHSWTSFRRRSTSSGSESVFLFPMGPLQEPMSLPAQRLHFTHANRWDLLESVQAGAINFNCAAVYTDLLIDYH